MRIPLTPPSPFWADLESPLADRLTALWCADGNYEVVSGAFGILSGTTPPVQSIGDVGIVYKFPGGAANVSYIDLGVHPQHADIAKGTPFTVFSVYSALGDGTFVCHSDNNTVNAGWLFNFQTAGVGLYVEHQSINASAQTGGSVFPVSALANSNFCTALASYDGLNTTTSGAAYFNGRSVTSSMSSAAGTGIQGSDATQHLYIGGNNSGLSNHCFNGSLKMIAIWRRVLAPEEALRLHLDPLALYRAPSRRRHRIGGLAIAGAASVQPVVFACT